MSKYKDTEFIITCEEAEDLIINTEEIEEKANVSTK